MEKYLQEMNLQEMKTTLQKVSNDMLILKGTTLFLCNAFSDLSSRLHIWSAILTYVQSWLLLNPIIQFVETIDPCFHSTSSSNFKGYCG